MVLADSFNLTNDQVTLALIALMGGGMASFFKLVNHQSKQNAKLTKSFDNNNKALNRIASATEKGNQEAEKRNGHLAELVIQQGEATKALADGAVTSIVEAMHDVPEQHIEHQHVESVTVEKKK